MSLIAVNLRLTDRCREALALCRSAYLRMRNPYRPELHYMRGPGPKWREAHVVMVGAGQPALPD